MKKKQKVLILTLIVFTFGIIIFRNISLKPLYNESISLFVEEQGTSSGHVKLIQPRFSFGITDNFEENFVYISFKNFRSNRVLKKEVEKYIQSYEKIECNNKIYYFDSKEGYTIVEYSVENHIIYSTINYKYIFGNYCDK